MKPRQIFISFVFMCAALLMLPSSSFSQGGRPGHGGGIGMDRAGHQSVDCAKAYMTIMTNCAATTQKSVAMPQIQQKAAEIKEKKDIYFARLTPEERAKITDDAIEEMAMSMVLNDICKVNDTAKAQPECRGVMEPGNYNPKPGQQRPRATPFHLLKELGKSLDNPKAFNRQVKRLFRDYPELNHTLLTDPQVLQGMLDSRQSSNVYETCFGPNANYQTLACPLLVRSLDGDGRQGLSEVQQIAGAIKVLYDHRQGSGGSGGNNQGNSNQGNNNSSPGYGFLPTDDTIANTLDEGINDSVFAEYLASLPGTDTRGMASRVNALTGNAGLGDSGALKVSGRYSGAAPKGNLLGSGGAPAGEAKALPLDVGKSQYHSKMASIKLTEGNSVNAIDAANMALSHDPNNIDAYRTRIQAYMNMHRYADAIRDANYILSMQPPPDKAELLNAHLLKMAADLELGNYKDVLADKDKVEALLNGEYNEAFFAGIMVAAENAKDYDTMFRVLERMAQAQPDKYEELFHEKYLKYAPFVKSFAFNQKFLDNVLKKYGINPRNGGEEGEAQYSPLTVLSVILGGILIASIILWQIVKTLRDRKNLAIGTVDHFNLVKVIGEGGMGVVYEATDTTLDRRVAIKKVKNEGMSQSAKDQLLAEARTVASLHHPNIVDIYSVFEKGGSLFLVFEYINGKTLETVLNEDGKLDMLETKALFKSICEALDYAHDHGVIHHDLKPSNIMITNSGVVKVMDFGVSQNMNMEHKGQSVAGTPAYMAPEHKKSIVCKESDIYSLGICLYETLTGYVPSEIDGYDEANNIIVPPSQIISTIPASIDDLIARATNSNVSARIKTPLEFWRQLKSVE